MAVVALQHRVRTDQWETILVVANLLQRNLPALHRVAALAVRSKLAAMNIRVAIRTIATHLFEDQAHVAFCAGDFGVHAAQRVARVIVIELRIGADRLPTRVGVAFLAGNRRSAVRIGDFRLGTSHVGPRVVRRLLRRRAHQQRDESSDQRDEPACALHRTLRIPYTGPQRSTHARAAILRRHSAQSFPALLRSGEVDSRIRFLGPENSRFADAGYAGDLYARPSKHGAGFNGMARAFL